MFEIKSKIIGVQDTLKQRYSIEEYNKAIEKLTSKTDDPEDLAYMSCDMTRDPELRLFALAAMGEL